MMANLTFTSISNAAAKAMRSGQTKSPLILSVYAVIVLFAFFVLYRSISRDNSELVEDAAEFKGADAATDAATDGASHQGARLESDLTAPTHSGYPFKTYAPGSLTYKDIDDCGFGEFDLLATRARIPESTPITLVIGQQKAGTSWLYQVLKKVSPVLRARDVRDEPQRDKEGYMKEVHWLDHVESVDTTWISQDTAFYLDRYTSMMTADDKAALAAREAALFDITPSYIASYAAPARAKAIMPHARIVLLIRDPVARTLSAFRMWRRLHCEGLQGEKGDATDCKDPTIEEYIEAVLAEVDKRPSSLCFFGDTSAAPMNWMDCVCSKSDGTDLYWADVYRAPKKWEHPDVRGPRSLTRHHHMMASNVAPQLAWWLAFFPAEQIKIVTASELHDPPSAEVAVNKILEHAGIRNFARVTLEAVTEASGFNTQPREEPDISHLIPRLRAAFAEPEAALKKLINEHWPDIKFEGLYHEIE